MDCPLVLGSSRLYLASRSPRRGQLLSQLGVSFQRVDGDVDETPVKGEAAQDMVQRLALAKARAGYYSLHGSGLASGFVLGSDTEVVFKGGALGKPENQDDGVRMLLSLSDTAHEVMTAVALVCGKKERVSLVKTQVIFGPISEQDALLYWNTGEPVDKAGGYGIQGVGGTFVRRIEGSYSNVVGLPLFETAAMLEECGIATWKGQ